MKRVLFLTSTVSPSNIKFAGTLEQRRQEYLKAIRFYMDHTDYPVLVVDNSGYDFGKDFGQSDRLECLAYKAENHSGLGKGYGEMLLMQYGFDHSHLLAECDQIVKITGRHIVKNVELLVETCRQQNAVYADVDIHLTFAMTYFFLAPKEFYTDYLFPNVYKLNDSQHFFLEHLVAEELVEWLKAHKTFHEFRKPIYLVGHQGSSTIPYRAPGWDRYFKIQVKFYIREIMNHLFKLSFANGR